MKINRKDKPWSTLGISSKKKQSIVFIAEELIVCEVSDVGASIVYTNQTAKDSRMITLVTSLIKQQSKPSPIFLSMLGRYLLKQRGMIN